MGYIYNKEYFNVIDSEDKAYWLGFIAADGCLRNTGMNKRQLVIKLSNRDINHIEKFRKSIDSNHKIYTSESVVVTKKGNISKSIFSIIRISGLNLYNQLVDKGVTSRKTHTLDKPNIPEEYYRHYIRGLFDGDGHCEITERKNGRLLIRYSIATVAPKMIEFLFEVFDEIGIESARMNQINLRINRIEDNIKFYDYLYDDATIYLQRKKDSADKFMDYRKDIIKWERKYKTKKIISNSIVFNDKDVDLIIKMYNKGIKPNKMIESLPHLKIRQIYRRIEKLKTHKMIENTFRAMTIK